MTQLLNNYLRMYRKRAGLTQREVAQLLGCTYGSKVSRYERGERMPPLETILAYEVIFRVPASELFPGVHRAVAMNVANRIRALLQRLDAEPYTPHVKQKFDALVDLVYPGAGSNQQNAA